MLDAEAGAKCLATMKQHEAQVVKCQALARGHLARNKHGRNGKGKGKNSKGGPGRSELEQKMLSARSGQFRGGNMPSNRRGGDSQRNGLVYAKQLANMPDYSNEATRQTEQQVGPFEWEEDES